jgi:PadR family transcriptional regulator, regulatory protein PadR
MDGQMKKGVLELCVLYLISEKDRYGYEILKQIAPAFPEVQEAVVYSILRRICANGYSQTYIGGASNGPQRKYYKITDLGSAYLSDCIDEWQSLSNKVNSLINPSDA